MDTLAQRLINAMIKLISVNDEYICESDIAPTSNGPTQPSLKSVK